MNRPLAFFIFLLIGISITLNGQDSRSSGGSYFSQPSPGRVPQIFARGIISTERSEHATPAFCGMNEFYFSRIAGNGSYFENTHYSMGRDNTWKVDTLEIERKYISTEYYPSRDGKRLYFSSLRPSNIQTDSAKKIWNIWYSDITANGWSEPRPMPAPVNSGFHEGQFFEAIDGSFYFTSWRNNNQPDIFRAILKNGKYEIDTLFGKNMNTVYDEKDPVLSEKGDFLLFKSNRPGGIGKNDIYISFLETGNSWSEPVNAGSKINSQNDEWYPRVSPDGNYLFFLSDRSGNMDVYWIDVKGLDNTGWHKR